MRAPDPNDGLEEYRKLIRLARKFEMLGYDLREFSEEDSKLCHTKSEEYVRLAQKSRALNEKEEDI